METIIKIDMSSKMAQGFLKYVRTLPFVKIVKNSNDYDPAFVKKVLDADEKDKRVQLKTKSVWESI